MRSRIFKNHIGAGAVCVYHDQSLVLEGKGGEWWEMSHWSECDAAAFHPRSWDCTPIEGGRKVCVRYR